MNEVRYDSRPETFAHIATVRGYMLAAVKELIDRAHAHDETKLVSPELEVFDEVSPRLRSTEYGSEEYKRSLDMMGPALTHHYANTRHHPESFPKGIRGMSLIDLLEMISDWMAAVQRHDDGHDIHKSIELNQDRFHYSDELKEILENTVDTLEAAA